VLGNTLAQEQKQSAVKTDEKVLAEITEFFANNPGTTFKADCLPTLSCNSDRARRIFNAALRNGLFEKNGSGKRGDAFTYRSIGLPTEEKRAA
jgi:predicted HTH transcriptional regulator